MNQSDRGNYRTNETFGHQLTHSCLGQIAIIAVVALVMLIIAAMSVPDKETMLLETIDNVCQCIQSNDSIKTDKIDTMVDNVGFTFTHVDSTFNEKDLDTFNKYNRIEHYSHPFYATTYIFNNVNPEGKMAGFGVFGMVLSTVNYRNLLMYVDKMRGDFNERIYKETYYEDDHLNENPALKPYHYQGDPTQ